MLREGKSTAGDFRIPSGCAVSSVFSRSGKRLDGSDIIRSIEIMHDRSNALAAASPATAFTRNMRNSMRFTFSIIM